VSVYASPWQHDSRRDDDVEMKFQGVSPFFLCCSSIAEGTRVGRKEEEEEEVGGSPLRLGLKISALKYSL
jgi:hypothetical protein